MRHYHTTPFEMCELKIHIRVPMDCWRQYIRHRTASVNEYSTRYSEAIDSMAKTAPNQWRLQSKSNKQGSAEFLDDVIGDRLSVDEALFHVDAERIYKERLEAGVAKEQARKDLPLSNYTEAYWKIDLHNLFHFLRLRLDSHAQLEIRLFAEAVASIAKELWPVAYEAFEDYRLNAVNFSAQEMVILRKFIDDARDSVDDSFGFNIHLEEGLSKREKTEFESKVGEDL